ncbi:MAG: transporter substrate-binding domain-containing protein [Gammaproteobacteria bacterium]|nr:transporter substrate-binding domain-containing protein [Gammaproteobacteria bacterium]NNM01599.1 transporter substrate-binding domain-containing protein [Gammaproteobacteria bacterium]
MFRTRRLVISFVALLCACSAQGAGADAFTDILERKVMRVGVSLFTPWAMRGKDGALTGAEIDIANKLAMDMGVTPEFKVYDWDAIIPALNKGEIDVIIAGMHITPKRALRVVFSRPYEAFGVGLATNTAMTRDINDLSGLNRAGIVITTVTETQAAELAPTLFPAAEIRAMSQPEAAEKLVVDGKAHAYIATVDEARFLALRHPGKVDVPLDEPLLRSEAGFAVRRGEQELLNYFNAWITARKADRWLDATHKYWFETLRWMDEVAAP